MMSFVLEYVPFYDQPPPQESIITMDHNNIHRWFKGGKLNTSYLALDVHVDRGGLGDEAAILWDSPVTGSKQRISYSRLRDKVAHFAGVLADQGVKKGDRVMIYMPMIPEAIIAMLACARIGAIHSVVFGGEQKSSLVSSPCQ